MGGEGGERREEREKRGELKISKNFERRKSEKKPRLLKEGKINFLQTFFKTLTDSTLTWCGRLVATSDAWSPLSPLAAAMVVTVWRSDQRDSERSKLAGVLGVAASDGG